MIVSTVLSFLSGALIGKYYQQRQTAKQQAAAAAKELDDATDEDDDEEDFSTDEDDVEYSDDIGACKMVLVVRTDLQMTKGKIAAQCCHGTLGAYKRASRNKKFVAILKQWEIYGQAKVTLKVNNEKDLVDLEKAAKSADVPHYLVVDAGRTQIASGSFTVLAIGPAPIAKIDAITGKLGLL
eukprot:gene6697-7788_t